MKMEILVQRKELQLQEIDPKDIMNQKGIILKLVSKIKKKQNNKVRSNDDERY